MMKVTHMEEFRYTSRGKVQICLSVKISQSMLGTLEMLSSLSVICSSRPLILFSAATRSDNSFWLEFPSSSSLWRVGRGEGREGGGRWGGGEEREC